MSTIREQVIAAVEAILATASADVHPDWEAVDKGVQSGIIAGDFLDRAETNNLLDKHTLEMPMGFFARGNTARSVADALQDEVFGLLMVDPSFGGLVKTFKAGPVQGRNEATGGRSCFLTQTYTAEFFTQAGSQTAPA
jgi:hypothetical protein